MLWGQARVPVQVVRCVTVMLVTVLVQVQAQAQTGRSPTYTEDVALIMQEKCQVCHQPKSAAPMSFLTYEEILPWAPLIRMRVAAGDMPPWHLNPHVGIQRYRNDRSLSDEQRQTIVDWVDAGAPLGPLEKMPPARRFPDPNRWQLGDVYGREPDLVVKSAPFDLAAVTQDKWFQPVVASGLTEDRWVRGIEIKPSYPLGRRAVHHAMAFVAQSHARAAALPLGGQQSSQQEGGLFMEWSVGKVGEIYPEGTGKLLKAGATIGWDIHLHAIGEAIEGDVVELGLWFYDKGDAPSHPTVLRSLSAVGEAGIDVRPHETAMTQQFHVVDAPVRLENFQPHMHRVGKAMSMEVIYPNGRREVLSHVDNFQWRWHNNYIYAEDAAPLIPAGSTLVITAWYDNTDNNPDAPDPRQWVGFGDRIVDEMGHAWVNFTYLDQDEFERLVAERQARQQSPQQDQR